MNEEDDDNKALKVLADNDIDARVKVLIEAFRAAFGTPDKRAVVPHLKAEASLEVIAEQKIQEIAAACKVVYDGFFVKGEAEAKARFLEKLEEAMNKVQMDVNCSMILFKDSGSLIGQRHMDGRLSLVSKKSSSSSKISAKHSDSKVKGKGSKPSPS